jgi:hypothetical protein
MASAVVVIGGGLAGLTAAWTLRTKHGIEDVHVLEARDRVGGRTHSRPLGPHGVRFDLGGQWIGPHQDEIEGLARELGVETMRQPFRGVAVCVSLSLSVCVCVCVCHADRVTRTTAVRRPGQCAQVRTWVCAGATTRAPDHRAGCRMGKTRTLAA